MGVLKGRVVAFAAAMCVLGSAATAQISPGELAKAHAFMEGVKNCLKCHQLGAGPSAEKCLECHTAIAQRVEAGKGYHHVVINEEKQTCFACHGDHAGRAFELVRWPDGRDHFEHARTGWPLAGAHTRAKCRDCHRAQYIADDLSRYGDNVNAERTFLGLATRCLGCHEDVHSDQLSDACGSCHGNDAWKPAVGFDHDKTAYPLRGAHARVRCAACHPATKDKDGKTVRTRYAGIAHDNCSSCHKDAHRGRLGPDCASCHRVSGWHDVRAAGFDHGKTRFPLAGRHRSVACARCHGDRMQTASMRFDVCSACHADSHAGQFAARPDDGRCESCHTVDGFAPATFTVADHEAAFALRGAHLAIPCVSCHDMARIGKQETRRFRDLNRTCDGCHEDTHRGQFAAGGGSTDCQRCHGVDGWRPVSFDHDRDSTYRLEGQHRVVPCAGCHVQESRDSHVFVRYKPINRSCEHCHAASVGELN